MSLTRRFQKQYRSASQNSFSVGTSRKKIAQLQNSRVGLGLTVNRRTLSRVKKWIGRGGFPHPSDNWAERHRCRPRPVRSAGIRPRLGVWALRRRLVSAHKLGQTQSLWPILDQNACDGAADDERMRAASGVVQQGVGWNAQQMIDRGGQVAWVVGVGGWVRGRSVAGAVDCSGPDACAGQGDGVDPGPVVAAGVAVDRRCAAEFGRGHNERLVR